MTLEELKALPKIELHCHLDGSLSREFLESRLGRKVEPSEIHVSDDCQSLQEYLEKFDLPGQCLQDEEGLELAGYDVLKSMSQENVRYAEVRFAPLLSENENLSCGQVIEAVIRGMNRGKNEFGVDYGIITCAMRHHSYEENLRMIRTAREYLEMVCARQTLQELRPSIRCQNSWSYLDKQKSLECHLPFMPGSVETCRTFWIP